MEIHIYKYIHLPVSKVSELRSRRDAFLLSALTIISFRLGPVDETAVPMCRFSSAMEGMVVSNTAE